MTDIPLASAVLLFDSGLNGETPRAAVRPLGHDDYYTYGSQVGACFADYRAATPEVQKLRLMIEVWHAAAFHAVPAEMLHQALIVIPEYRDMLADDCLPKQFRPERGGF